jgi:hypothetical protein
LKTAASSVGPGEVLCLCEEEDTETADRIPKVTAAETSRPEDQDPPLPRQGGHAQEPPLALRAGRERDDGAASTSPASTRTSRRSTGKTSGSPAMASPIRRRSACWSARGTTGTCTLWPRGHSSGATASMSAGAEQHFTATACKSPPPQKPRPSRTPSTTARTGTFSSYPTLEALVRNQRYRRQRRGNQYRR